MSVRLYDGGPRHHCGPGCPPWRFAWAWNVPGGRDWRYGDHTCSTHCLRHPDPRTGSPRRVAEQVVADPAVIRGALSICDWESDWAVRFLLGAGAPHA